MSLVLCLSHKCEPGLNGSRNAGILSIKLIFSLKLFGKLVDFVKGEIILGVSCTLKHSGDLRTLEKCRKHSLAACVFYTSLVLSNARHVLSQCNTRLRLLYLLSNFKVQWPTCK